MVKTNFLRIILGLNVVGYSALAVSDDITNINQCMNTNLSADILRQFPCHSTSTVQHCVLAFVKGSVNGNLKTFAEPFSAQIRFTEFGISDLNNIPITTENEFSALMTSVSNCENKVVSYDESTNNGVVRATITFRRQGVGYNRTEVSHLDLVETNNYWQITNWDVDE